jgi:hypothetical protein
VWLLDRNGPQLACRSGVSQARRRGSLLEGTGWGSSSSSRHARGAAEAFVGGNARFGAAREIASLLSLS